MSDKFLGLPFLFWQERIVTIRVILIAILLSNLGCQPKIISQSEVDKRSQITVMYQEYAQDFSQVTDISVDMRSD